MRTSPLYYLCLFTRQLSFRSLKRLATFGILECGYPSFALEACILDLGSVTLIAWVWSAENEPEPKQPPSCETNRSILSSFKQNIYFIDIHIEMWNLLYTTVILKDNIIIFRTTNYMAT